MGDHRNSSSGDYYNSGRTSSRTSGVDQEKTKDTKSESDGLGSKSERTERGSTSTQKDYTELYEKLTLQVREDLKKIEKERAQADKERNLSLENHALKLQNSFFENQLKFFKEQAERDEKLRAELTKFASLPKPENNNTVEKLSSIETGLYAILQKVGELEMRVRSIEDKVASIEASNPQQTQQTQPSPSSSSQPSYNNSNISVSSSNSNNSPQPQSGGWFQGKTHNIYIWRLDSARTTFPRFSDSLREYIEVLEKKEKSWLSRGPSTRFAVIDITGLEGITTEGTLLLCCFTPSVRIEAEPILEKKRIIEQNPKVANKIHYLIFRYGDKALPAKVVDENSQELAIPCLNVYYDSKGFITNDYTTNALKKITTI